MDSIVRALVMYFFLLVVFRISGKRLLSQTTNFDFVLLLIISEPTQQAMVDDDHSITNGFLLILTLVGTTIALSVVKQYFPTVEHWLDGTAVLVIDEGKLREDVMDRERVDKSDILESAREQLGIGRLADIRYAVVERSGQVSVIPHESKG